MKVQTVSFTPLLSCEVLLSVFLYLLLMYELQFKTNYKFYLYIYLLSFNITNYN